MLIRQEFIESINSHISDIYFKITNKGPLSVRFKSEYLNKTKEQLLNIFQNNIFFFHYIDKDTQRET